MGDTDIERLKADASGNTALSETLAEAVADFMTTDDAVNFLTARGFDLSARDLTEAAAAEAREETPVGEGEGGYGALMKFMANH
ncbi:hypothetical protein [Roseixanthobacter glucoisosaccharinicivorans]|uniref:hypothetical protein n=1 Tax=Roseixanthobacter glucoisosaccharinicivorans TaxID=3119923 RepID=UPI003728E773